MKSWSAVPPSFGLKCLPVSPGCVLSALKMEPTWQLHKVWLHGVWIPFPSFKGKRSCSVAVRLWISVFPLWIYKIFNSIWFCFMQKIPYMLDLHMESFHRFWVFVTYRLFEGERICVCVCASRFHFFFSSNGIWSFSGRTALWRWQEQLTIEAGAAGQQHQWLHVAETSWLVFGFNGNVLGRQGVVVLCPMLPEGETSGLKLVSKLRALFLMD